MTDKDAQQRIKELEAAAGKYVAEISRLEFKIGELGGEINRLHAELQRQRGARAQASGLYRAVDDAIIHRIDQRGYRRKQPRRRTVAIAPEVLQSTDKTTLHKAAEAYDVATFFTYHAPKTGMRLQYRLLSKAYRTGRDVAKFGLKKTYRVVRKIA